MARPGDTPREELERLKTIGPMVKWGVTVNGVQLDGVGPVDLTDVPDVETLPYEPGGRAAAARRGSAR